MKRYLIILATVLFSVTVNAQGVFEHHKIRIGLSVTPSYSFRNLKAPDSFQATVDAWNALDRAKIGYSATFNLIFALHNRIAIETGVAFIDRGHKTQTNITGVTSPGTSIGTAKFRFHYNYIGIPLKANIYLIAKGKVRLFVSGGLNSSVLISSVQNSNLNYTNGNNIQDRVRTKIQSTNLVLSATAGLGLDIRLIKRLSLRLEPLVNYAFYNSMSSPIKYLPYEIGGTVGLHVGFK